MVNDLTWHILNDKKHMFSCDEYELSSLAVSNMKCKM